MPKTCCSSATDHINQTPADINEAQRVEWISLDTIHDRIKQGEIVGAASIIGLLAALTQR